LADFFASDTRLAWIIHPDEEFAAICHSRTDRRIVGPAGFLEGEGLLPGFRFEMKELFKDWEW